jgi:hydroxyacylglutathione hydrolase
MLWIHPAVEETTMKLQRFEVPGLAHYSYLIACGGQAVIVDPKRDVDTYLDAAQGAGLRITHILETHIHADYCSGALELAQRTGAELWLSGHDQGETFEYAFPHRKFKDGEELKFGNVRMMARYTPGHTPEHLSFVVRDGLRGDYPMALLSGDFVFVGSLGRPDLLGEEAKRKLAGELYESLHRLTDLPDGVEIHPAHGAGSMCGAGMSDRPQSTLGYERACNLFFREQGREEFIDTILKTVPPFPDYYRRMKKVNSAGPKVFDELPGGQSFPVADFRAGIADQDAVVIDLRSPEAFGGGHIPGAFSIGAGRDLSTWAAWVVPYDRPIYLVGDDSTPYEEARRSLVRVGLDEVRGSLRGGMRAWTEAGDAPAQVPQIPVEELSERLKKGAYLLDVRGAGEWASGHVEGAAWIMGGDLAKRVGEVPTDRPVHVMCGGGYRSSVATSVLKRAGLREVVNVTGGMNAWKQRQLPTVTEQAAVSVA